MAAGFRKLQGLYRTMVSAREFELAMGELWQQGAITGEMHAGTGEEAVAAGVVAHLSPEDSLALSHRCSPFIVARNVPLVPVVRELLGRADGLCRGQAGHMHLMSRKHRFAASGIVGASLPAAAGFALAARRLRGGAIAVAQTGDGALNQGMALETLNLAVVWKLPMLVVCIDNGWAITAPAGELTAGDLSERAAAFGWEVAEADGIDVESVHAVAGELIERIRGGHGPAFLYTVAPRMAGHYLGDPLLRVSRHPLAEGRRTLGKVISGATAEGDGLLGRAAGLTRMGGVLRKARATPRIGSRKDPLVVARRRLGTAATGIDKEARAAVRRAIDTALEAGDG